MKVALRRFLPGLAILGVLGAVVPGVLLSLGGLPTPQGLASALHEGVTGWSWICCWLGWSGAVLASLRDLLRALASDPLARARAGVVGTALAALLLSASPAGASRVHAAAIQQVSARSPLPGARIPSPNARHAPWLVAPGDSLWSIAEASLDDPSAWVAIWNANRARVMNDGRIFVDPSLILPGWSLNLPSALLNANTAEKIRITHATTASPESQSLRAAPISIKPAAVQAGDKGLHEVAVVSPQRWLPPSLSIAGGSILSLILLGNWLKRRRGSLGDRVCAAWSALDDDLLDRLEALDSLASEPMVDQVAAALGEIERLGIAELVLALGIGNDGPIAVLSSRKGLETSQEFNPDGHLRLDIKQYSESTELPALLCLGDSDRASFVAPLRPGLIISFSGPGARQVLRAATAQLSWWPWTEDLVVSADADLVEREVNMRPRASVVFTGDPMLLSPELRRELAIVTTAPTKGALNCILAEDGSISFDGIALSRGDLNTPLLITACDLDDRSHARVLETALAVLPVLPPSRPLVRLLTRVPQVEGLSEDLPAERSRKAIELLAYLTIHQGSAVPADRLRARIFGQRDGDGSAKTLANMAALLRRALGVSKDGSARLPSASAYSGYQVFDVDSDYHRFITLCSEAEFVQDSQTRIALHREALNMIEDEPFALSPSGYQWWESEGHGAHIGMLAVAAAWSMVDDAQSLGSIELAHWAIERARLLSSHSESLWRAKMVLAGIALDHDGLLQAWEGCNMLATSLEEGALPSAAAEQTMHRVAERIKQIREASGSGELGGDAPR